MVNERRMHWTIQQGVKVRALPYLLRKIYSGEENHDSLRSRFEIEFESVATANTAASSTPFQRTMNFMRDYIMILGEDYAPLDDLSPDSDIESIRLIFDYAKSNLVPFRIMMQLFDDLDKEVYEWSEFARTLSLFMIRFARDECPIQFDKKQKDLAKKGQRIEHWVFDDISLNRLVELGSLLKLCTFVVYGRVRHVASVPEASAITDLHGLIRLLKREEPGLESSMQMTVDRLLSITKGQSISNEIIEDICNNKDVKVISGRDNESQSLEIRRKVAFRLRFDRGLFK